ncbi:hypothetical protein H1W00_09495 [Aeromicrobium sp. Marseille-Q0843]|uniref:Thioredoxin domain-containing protein n=1 Tax=Aeromicrobium phoceense TaxID=2754045 RepID=A0A838XDT7_9ACTN|nr:hypothetical protein [Aeromicrobium phoceense]MBA4608705.1 hypothetical protein [Aeromicrobium phoceense]
MSYDAWLAMACVINLILFLRLHSRLGAVAKGRSKDEEFVLCPAGTTLGEQASRELGIDGQESVLLYLSFGCPVCGLAIRQLPRWVELAGDQGLNVAVVAEAEGEAQLISLRSQIHDIAPSVSVHAVADGHPVWAQLNSRQLTPAFIHVRDARVIVSGEYGGRAWQRFARGIVDRARNGESVALDEMERPR